MLSKIREMANRPKKAATRKELLWICGWQAAFLVVILFVVTFWPERAFALSGFALMSLGITAMIWLEAYDGRLGNDAQVHR